MSSEYPFVYVVDSHATGPPVPPRPSQRRQRGARLTQNLLFLLVSVALGGLIVEAAFIYSLHRTESASSASLSQLMSGEGVSSARHSKPVAHLTDGQNVVHGKHIMAWTAAARLVLFGMDHQHRHLVVPESGYYYVYSKVFFVDTRVFHHSVKMLSTKYEGDVTLLQSRKYSSKVYGKSNSYLGGVFLLEKDDALFVTISDTADIVRSQSYENVFGAFML